MSGSASGMMKPTPAMGHGASSRLYINGDRWIFRDNRRRILGNDVEAVRRAFTDTGRAVPDEYRYRTVGAQDVDPAAGD
jgi:hypothetical protein